MGSECRWACARIGPALTDIVESHNAQRNEFISTHIEPLLRTLSDSRLLHFVQVTLANTRDEATQDRDAILSDIEKLELSCARFLRTNNARSPQHVATAAAALARRVKKEQSGFDDTVRSTMAAAIAYAVGLRLPSDVLRDLASIASAWNRSARDRKERTASTLQPLIDGVESE